MKKLTTTLILLLTVVFLSFGQDVKPISPLFKNLPSPSFSFMVGGNPWIYKGSSFNPNPWTELAGWTNVKDTLTHYWNKNEITPSDTTRWGSSGVDISGKEDKSNKENTTVNNDTTKYPTVNLLKTYAAPISGSTNYVQVSPSSAQIGFSNLTQYKLNGNDLFGSLSSGYLPYWDGGKFVNSTGYVSGSVVTYQANSGTYIPLRLFGDLKLGDNWYGSLLVGRSENINQATQFGWAYNEADESQSFAHITPFGAAEGSLFKLVRNGNLILGTLASTNARLLSVSPTGQITPIADGTNGQVLGTDGNGGYSFVNQSGGTETITTQTLSGTSPTWDIALGKNATITLSGTTTITLSNLVSGTSGNLTVSNPTTSYNITFSGYTIWISQAIYYSGDAVVTSGLGKIDAFSWYYDGNIVLINGQVGYK